MIAGPLTCTEPVTARLLVPIAAPPSANVVPVATPSCGVVMIGAVSVLFVSVWMAVSVTTVSLVPGNVIVVPSVPASVSELLNVRFLADAPVTVEPDPVEASVKLAPVADSVTPFAMVSVALVAGAVIATLLMLVALATPSVGVVRFILVAAMPLGSVVESDGTPVPLVTSTALLAVARPATALVAEVYSS